MSSDHLDRWQFLENPSVGTKTRQKLSPTTADQSRRLSAAFFSLQNGISESTHW
jgi:hypothetical protein